MTEHFVLYQPVRGALQPVRPGWENTTPREDVQGRIFGEAGAIEYSWVVNSNWAPHQRFELENDLLASYLLVAGAVPAAQFLG